jgi:hypothetical protein
MIFFNSLELNMEYIKKVFIQLFRFLKLNKFEKL